MTVYVDDMKAAFGRMVMCHMIADTTEELLAMADRIGVARKWLQYPGTHKEHFDIALSKRAEAVKAGAVEITWRETGVKARAKREALINGSLEHGTEDTRSLATITTYEDADTAAEKAARGYP